MKPQNNSGLSFAQKHTRRDFLKVAGGTALGLTLSGVLAPSLTQAHNAFDLVNPYIIQPGDLHRVPLNAAEYFSTPTAALPASWSAFVTLVTETLSKLLNERFESWLENLSNYRLKIALDAHAELNVEPIPREPVYENGYNDIILYPVTRDGLEYALVWEDRWFDILGFLSLMPQYAVAGFAAASEVINKMGRSAYNLFLPSGPGGFYKGDFGTYITTTPEGIAVAEYKINNRKVIITAYNDNKEQLYKGEFAVRYA